jgi:methylmalonyl-CoA/ethylmalonyl-CoA epimerase
MVQELDHIGIAVRSLQEALPIWIDGLGLRLDRIEEVPTEKVRVAMLYAGDTRIELIEPTAPDSPIQGFLDKRGGGVHHLAFQVPDAQEAIDALQTRGLPLLDRRPRPGAHGTRVAFVHPRGVGGVLAELVERAHGD